jgi:hypothetical protein
MAAGSVFTLPLGVAVHESEVTNVPNGIEPRSYFPIASGDYTNGT